MNLKFKWVILDGAFSKYLTYFVDIKTNEIKVLIRVNSSITTVTMAISKEQHLFLDRLSAMIYIEDLYLIKLNYSWLKEHFTKEKYTRETLIENPVERPNDS